MFEVCLKLFLILCLAHVICDYPLQGDFLSKAKNPAAPIPGVPWYQAMGAHVLMHAGAVTLITGSWILGAIEFVLHFIIDWAKCAGHLSFNEDQFCHVMRKALYVILLSAAAIP